MRIPSTATSTTLAPQSSASSAPTGDSFVVLLNEATVKWYPVQQSAGTTPKEQSQQGPSNGAMARQAEAQTTAVQGNGSSSAIPSTPAEDHNESVAREASNLPQKGSRKPGQAASSQPSIPGAYAPNTTLPMPQIAEVNASNVDLSLGQGISQSAIEGSSAANEHAAIPRVSRAGSEAGEPEHSQPAFNGAASESIKLSQDLWASIKPLNADDPDDVSAQAEPTELQSFAPGFVSSTDVGTLLQPMPFSMLNLSEMQSESGMHGNTTQQLGSAKSASANQDAVNAADSGTSKTGDSANSSSDTPAHSAQSASTESSQNSATVQRVVDIASSHQNAQSAVNQGVSIQSASAPRIADAPGQAAHSGAMRQAADPMDADSTAAMPTSAISDAKLMQTLTESQMRIGLSSNAFGDISIRTSISGHQMVAQISLDHNELSQAMSAQISSVQTKLNDEHGLQATIEINSHASLNSSDAGGSSHRERGSPTAPASASGEVASGSEGNSLNQEAIVNAVNETRLDIRA
ncbi:MAG: hypothetical protein ABSE46_09245 [Terracidiphilus sp.]